jgi:hypothetical protein
MKMNKPIEITEKNKDRINTAIREIEGKARLRTLTYTDCEEAVKLMRTEVPCTLTDLNGTIMFYQPGAHKFAKAYYGVPEATYIRVLVKHGRFYLTEIGRTPCNFGTTHAYKLSETAKPGMIRKLELGYR